MTPTLSADNKGIQCFWTGPLTTMELLSVSSFLAQGHEVELYCYDRDRSPLLQALPGEVYLRDAEEIVPPDSARTFRCAAQLSDFFRIALLHTRGGWYVDLDTICLRPFNFSTDHVFYRDHDESTISFAVSKAPTSSPLMRHCYDYLAVMPPADRAHLTWQEIGTEFVTGAVEYFGLTSLAQPGYVFDPIHWQRAREVVNPEAEWDLSKSFAVHLFHAIWNDGPQDRSGKGFDLGQQPGPRLDTDALYHPDCLYSQLKAKYL